MHLIVYILCTSIYGPFHLFQCLVLLFNPPKS